MEEADPPLDNPITLKIEADEIESTYSLAELQESLALVVAYEEGHWKDVPKHHFKRQD